MAEDIQGPDEGDEIHLTNQRSNRLPEKDRNAVMKEAMKMSGETPEPEPAPKPAAKVEPLPAKPEPKPEPKAQTPPATEKKPDAPAEPAKPKGIAELRDAYTEAQKNIQKLNDSLGATTKEKADALAKFAQVEEAYTKATERISKELEPQVAKLKETEKRLQEREDVIRMKDYTQTTEWRDKYVEPLVQANAKKNRLLQETTVTVNGETGEPHEISAQPEHFDYVLGAKTTKEAFRRAKELFGDDLAQSVVNLRDEIRDHGMRQQEALRNAQLEAMEWQKNQQAHFAQERESTRNAVFSEASAYMQSKPEVFAPKEDDNDAVTALAEGQKFADFLINPPQDVSRGQMLKSIGEGRARIIESFALKPQMSKLQAENKALLEELEAYHKSEPDVRTREGGGSIPKAPSSKEEEHEAMLKAAMDLATSLT